MGLSKTEIDLIRLLEAASRQQNQTKLVHVSISSSLVRQLIHAPKLFSGRPTSIVVMIIHPSDLDVR